jgi:hypothetical protein
MQRSSQAYQSGAEVFQSRGYSASDIFSNVEDVTANKIHRDLTPPTMHAQAQIQAKFSQFIAVLKEQNRTEFDQYNLVHAFDAGADLLPLRKIFRILHTILKLNGTAAVIIAFLNYICLSSRGSIDERITVVTLQNKIGLFLGLVCVSESDVTWTSVLNSQTDDRPDGELLCASNYSAVICSIYQALRSFVAHNCRTCF